MKRKGLERAIEIIEENFILDNHDIIEIISDELAEENYLTDEEIDHIKVLLVRDDSEISKIIISKLHI